MLAKLARYLRDYGCQETWERIQAGIAMSLAGTAMRKRLGKPSLSNFYHQSTPYVSARDLIARHFAGDRAMEPLLTEYAAVEARIAERYAERALVYPRGHGLESGSGLALYCAVRLLRPLQILETGVANGHSTVVLLSALEKNEAGTLHSVDLGDDVGCLIAPEEKARWKFHLVSGARSDFGQLLESLPPLDLFIHDSDHTYWGQRFELERARPRIAAGGWMVCDDAEKSLAFLDFCRAYGLAPVLLLDGRKALGLVPVGRNTGRPPAC